MVTFNNRTGVVFGGKCDSLIAAREPVNRNEQLTDRAALQCR